MNVTSSKIGAYEQLADARLAIEDLCVSLSDNKAFQVRSAVKSELEQAVWDRVWESTQPVQSAIVLYYD